MKEAVLYKPQVNRLVRCLACSWYCTITPGQTGICATRMNNGGKLYSLVYGKIIGPALDPVEKKPLHHFLPGSTVLSFGTLGCNFGCLFCQNDWMSQTTKSPKTVRKIQHTIDQLSTSVTPKQLVDLAIRKHAVGIAYTYNEPAIFVEFALDVMKLAKKSGLKNIFVSNGYESAETFSYIKQYLDAINIDLKSFRREFYRKICKSDIEPVKENIKRYFDAGIETEVTTLIIPGFNDSKRELTDIAKFLFHISPDLPWHVSAFYPAYKMMDVPPTPPHTVISAWEIGKSAGLRYVYAGNISDTKHTTTVCPNCQTVLVERFGYETIVRQIDLQTGQCKRCHTAIYGTWSV